VPTSSSLLGQVPLKPVQRLKIAVRSQSISPPQGAQACGTGRRDTSYPRLRRGRRQGRTLTLGGAREVRARGPNPDIPDPAAHTKKQVTVTRITRRSLCAAWAHAQSHKPQDAQSGARAKRKAGLYRAQRLIMRLHSGNPVLPPLLNQDTMARCRRK
jgi:hypothetical protein